MNNVLVLYLQILDPFFSKSLKMYSKTCVKRPLKNRQNKYVTRHAKRYELGGRRHFEKIRLKVNVASRKNSTPKRVSKRSLTYYKTGSKAFFMLRFSATRLSYILYDIKCSLLNVRKLKLGQESSTQFSL